VQGQPSDSLARLLLGFQPAAAFGPARASAVRLHCHDPAFTTSRSAIRNRISTAPLMDDEEEEPKHIVIVQGASDIQAVTAACGKEVFCVGFGGVKRSKYSGLKLKNPRRYEDIQAAMELFPDADVVLLFDGDTKGRTYRLKIMERFPQARHAFMGAHLSVLKEDSGQLHAGHVGILHAAPEDIRNAVAKARAPQANQSLWKYSVSDLMEWGMFAPFGMAGPHLDAVKDALLPYGCVTDRRRVFAEYLGIGDCLGKQLIKHLNLFFDEEEVEKALEAMPKWGEPIPKKTTDGHHDNRWKEKLGKSYREKREAKIKQMREEGLQPDGLDEEIIEISPA